MLVFIPWLLICLATLIIKKYIITPRRGLIKLKSSSKEGKILMLIIISGASVYGILNVLLHFEGFMAGICYGLIFGLIFASCAYFTGLKRQYVFGALLGTCYFLDELSQALIINMLIGPISFIILGAAYFFYSFLIFYKFLRKYPLEKSVDIK